MSVRNSAGAVEISQVNVDYRDKRGAQIAALAPTSIRLEAGSFTALVGPSGCGKSTLLNIVAGFVKPNNGAAILDGKEITGPTPDVGVVFQQYALFPWFTALGNIEFALKRLKLPAHKRRERAMQALAEVGLSDRADQYPGKRCSNPCFYFYRLQNNGNGGARFS